MTSTEIDFPRGKYVISKDSLAKKGIKRPIEDELFGNRRAAADDETKSIKKRRKDRRITSGDTIEKIRLYKMTVAKLPINSTILGCILDVKDYEMSVQLPGAILSKVSITNISDSYNQSLTNYTQDPTGFPCPLKPKAMFSRGDLLPVKILDKTEAHVQHGDTAMSLVNIDASINPKDIYGEISLSTFIKNCSNLSVSAAVQSEEEHGYVMDIGIEGISGFLSFPEAKPFLEIHHQDKLYIGQVILTNVLSLTSDRLVKLTTKPVKVRKTENVTQIPSSCLQPGVTVPATILNINDRGLEVLIFNQYKGFVHRDYLKTIWDLPKSDYQIGSEVKGVVLFVNPLTRSIALSLRLPNDLLIMRKAWSKVRIGQLIEGAQVVGKDEKDSYIFKIGEGLKGVAPKGELADGYLDQDAMDLIENQMPVGSTADCRVKSFAYLDGYVKLTLRPSLLEDDGLSIDSLEVGQVVEGTVMTLTKQGLVLRLGFALEAFCPPIHYADKSITNPVKHFTPGKKIKCRVIRLDKSDLKPRVAVTCRKALIKETNILDDINKAKPGFYTKGIVVHTQPNGVLFEFFNKLRGWLSIKRLEKEGVQYSQAQYSIGQILPVYVANSDKKDKNIYLTLYYDESGSTSQTNNSKKLKSVSLGKILTNLTVSRKDSEGLNLEDDKKIEYFLPKGHLSDYTGLIDRLYDVIDIGDIIDEVVVFKIAKNVPIVSKKSAFIIAAKNKSLVFCPDDIETGLIVPAVVKNFKNYGIMVELPGGLFGLIPAGHISKEHVDPLNSGFDLNQTIFVFVNHVKEEDGVKRLNLSSVIDKCETGEYSPEIILRNYFLDYSLIKSKLPSIDDSSLGELICTIKPSDVYPFRVIEVRERQTLVLCKHPSFKDPIPAIIHEDNLNPEQELKIGSNGEGVVLYVDVEKKLCYLSAKKDLIKQVKSATKNSSYQRVRPGQVLIAFVQLITDKFYIISLQAHGIGALAYIPRYHHLNSLKPIPTPKQLKIGKKLYFSVKEKFESNDGVTYIVGAVTNEKPNSTKRKEEEKKEAKKAKKEKAKQAKLENSKRSKKEENSKTDDEKVEKKVSKKIADKCKNKDINKEDDFLTEDEEDDINFDDTDEEETEDEDGSESDVSDADNNVKIIIDRKGNLKKIRKTSTDENGVSDQESDEETNDRQKKAKKRKRLNTKGDDEDPANKLKKIKKKHFKKLQALVSDRVKSAVSGISENFFWDTTGDMNPQIAATIEEEEKTIKITKSADLDEEGKGPLSKEEFEKLVVESPNDVKRWSQFINYYLGQDEVNKAKELCERALESIDHKNEDAKLKIWYLKLKIENERGTPESLDALLKEALRSNDELKVYQSMVKMYEEAGATELAEKTYKDMTKKFPMNKSLWVDFGRFYLNHGLKESFRNLFQRCLNYMENKEQLDVIVKFAQLEFQFGDVERGKSLFEAALVNFPKRTDVWSIYIDMMIKYTLKEGNNSPDVVASIRLLFERAISIKIKAKKIKFLFQKYIDFEKKYGHEEKIADINAKCLQYVEANDMDN